MKTLAILIALAGCYPGQKWDRTNTALEVTFIGEASLDGYQTVGIVGNCQEYNPIIGECGQRVPVGAYIPGVMLAHAIVSYLLPPKARLVWQSATAGVEGHVIYFNAITPDQKR